MTGTLKAKVNGEWVPIAGSAQDAANVARWNTAWGVVGVQEGASDITCSVTPQEVASVTFTAVAGRRYAASYEAVGAMTATNNTLHFRLNLEGPEGTYLTETRVASPSQPSSQVQVNMICDSFTATAGSHRVVASFRYPAGYFVVMGSWGAWRLVVSDVGPVVPASIAPPTAGPRVVASGNALGIVGMASMLGQGGAVTVTQTPLPVSNPLSVFLAVGRRYRLRGSVRAVSPAPAAAAAYLIVQSAVTALPNHDTYAFISNAYDQIVLDMIINGTGLTERFTLAVVSTAPVNVWSDQIVSNFYVEDVGPNSAPALPIPETAQGWTPATLINGWQNMGYDYPLVGYRKIGDEVQLHGLVTSGTQGQAIAVLPPGFRSPKTLHFGVANNDAFGIVRMDLDGGINPTLYKGGWFSLDNVRFSVTA